MMIHEYKLAPRRYENGEIDKENSQGLSKQRAKHFFYQLIKRRKENQLSEHEEEKSDHDLACEEINFGHTIDSQLNKKLLKCDQDGKAVWEVVAGKLNGLVIECVRKDGLFFVTLIAPCLSIFYYINSHRQHIKKNLFSIGEISKLDIKYVDTNPF